ncbi:MAG: DEAD/DEAH box helicase, partial [Clostridiales bacterium]|nr:DEAD/DEAH box helicase [Clostridiales bacterium]
KTAVPERKRMVVHPFAGKAQAGEEPYRYFRIEEITALFRFYEDTVQKAKELLENGTFHSFRVDYGYTGGYESMDNTLAGRAQIFSDENPSGMPAADMFFRSSPTVNVRCHVPGCPGTRHWTKLSFGGRREACVHETALFLALEKELRERNYGDSTDREAQQMLNRFSSTLSRGGFLPASDEEDSASAGQDVGIVPRLQERAGALSLSFRIGTGGRSLIVKDFEELVDAVEEKREIGYGKSVSLNFAADRLDEDSRAWYEFINRYVQDERSRMHGFSGFSGAEGNPRQNIPLRASWLDEFYDLGREHGAFAVQGNAVSRQIPLRFSEGEARPALTLTEMRDPSGGDFSGVRLTGTLPTVYKGARFQYFCREDTAELIRISDNKLRHLKPLFDAAESGKVSLVIGRRNLSLFTHNILPLLREACDLEEPDAERIAPYLEPEVEFRFYLDAAAGVPLCRAKANYGTREEDLADWASGGSSSGLLYRDTIREQAAYHVVRRFFPQLFAEEAVFSCGEDEESIYSLLTEGIDELWRLGLVLATPAFDALKVRRRVSVRLGVSLESDLMDLSIISEDVSLEELLDILDSYKLKKKYHRLKNGEFVNLDDTIAELSTMVSALQLSPKEFIRGNMHLPAYRALYLDKMLEQAGDLQTNRDTHFRTLVKNFKTVEDSDFEVPETLRCVLRGYQTYGYKWLRTLASCGFGGILADDMGLGKTLQMIAVLLAEKEGGAIGTSLVICPASLVYNWADEFARFAPELAVCPVVGTQAERTAILQRYARWDVLITSYDLLKRDAACYEDLVFLYEILDEAQYIKNHATSAAKSVKIIRSRYRFALTGTPIENRLSELWSIFDYLMPGFLYGYEVFRREFEAPIVKKADEEASARLRRMVSPFILRRVKSDVLKDLPEKVEETRIVRLEKEQQQLYDAQVLRMKEMLASTAESELGKNRIRILAELTKIRQICCDPALLFEDYTGSSAKREACLDLVRSAIEGEHRILIFSQFTSMLALLKEDLEKEGVRFYELTGATPKKERLAMVNAFNAGDIPVFLISLKAGGTGLNLTGADIVIHYDPWWNAAAQNQATDRTHRIGQTRVVTVFKLIAKNSIEEKIQKMQELKLSLAEEIISSEGSSLGTLNREELLALLA